MSFTVGHTTFNDERRLNISIGRLSKHILKFVTITSMKFHIFKGTVEASNFS